MVRIQYGAFYRRLWEFPGWSRFFSLSLEARSSKDSLERLRSLVRSLISPWEKSRGSEEGGKLASEPVASLLSVDKTEPLSSSEPGNSNSGKPLNTGTGISLQCGIGLIADSRFGQINEFLFSCFPVDSLRVDCTEVAVIEIIFWFTPDHWNAKAEWLSILFCPLSKMPNTFLAYNIGCPYLILITQHNFEVSKISTLHTDPFPV